MAGESDATAEFTPCFCCGGPYHESTGGLHWVEHTQRWVPWCGACERDFVRWFAGHQRAIRRRIKIDGRTRVLFFYDYATYREE